MFSSVPTNWSTVSSWLGVGQRPKDDDSDDNKENTVNTDKTVDVKDSENSAPTATEEGNSNSSNSNEQPTESESKTSTETESKTSAQSPEESQSQSSPLDNINLDEMSAKALSTAKDFGSILFSFGKTALKHGTEAASQMKHVVEEKTILGDFAKEQNAFCSSRREASHKAEAAVPPWVGYNDEDSLRGQILQLSQDKRNFVRNPPSGVQFQFDFEACFPVAMATLQEDKNLEKMRFDLVPKAVNEETFWRNYFYRVSLIRQSSQLSSSLSALDVDAANKTLDLSQSDPGSRSSSSSRRSSTGTSGSDPKPDKDAPAPREDVLASSPPDNDDFVSDAFEESGLTEDDIRREMEQQIKGEGDKPVQDAVIEDGEAAEASADEEEWEKELMEEIMEEMKE